MLFWWICGGESVLILLLHHLGSSPSTNRVQNPLCYSIFAILQRNSMPLYWNDENIFMCSGINRSWAKSSSSWFPSKMIKSWMIKRCPRRDFQLSAPQTHLVVWRSSLRSHRTQLCISVRAVIAQWEIPAKLNAQTQPRLSSGSRCIIELEQS